jgi:hypothetical protein
MKIGAVIAIASANLPSISGVPSFASTTSIPHWHPAKTAFPASAHVTLRRSEPDFRSTPPRASGSRYAVELSPAMMPRAPH